MRPLNIRSLVSQIAKGIHLFGWLMTAAGLGAFCIGLFDIQEVIGLKFRDAASNPLGRFGWAVTGVLLASFGGFLRSVTSSPFGGLAWALVSKLLPWVGALLRKLDYRWKSTAHPGLNFETERNDQDALKQTYNPPTGATQSKIFKLPCMHCMAVNDESDKLCRKCGQPLT